MGKLESNVRKVKLRTKFAVLMVTLFAVALAVNVVWTTEAQRQQTENELQEKGLVLSQQMTAMWDFMSANQEKLEAAAYGSTGSYQGLHCAVVGRSIGRLFSIESGYTTRFVNFDPRNSEDEPDEFEAAGLDALYADPTLTYYASITQYDGSQVYRYMAPMEIKKSCLECHGEPAGELDVTGHAKEGWSVGDVGGAISIVIPMDIYIQAERDSVAHNVEFFVAVLVACLLIVYAALSYLVTRPLARIRGGVEKIQAGELDAKLERVESSPELNSLVDEFNKMTRELSDLYDSLESQVADRTAQLAQANAVLERQRAQLEEANERLAQDNQYKSDFLSMMSHELRTPLTSILAFSEILNSEGVPRDAREAQVRQEIEANSRVLLLMINDILEMSRVDAGRTELACEPVELGDIVGMVESVMRPLADRNGIDFSCSIDADVPLIEADFEKICHVAENLVGNAMKFTPEGGKIRVTVSYHPDCEQAWICVSDTGIGVAKADQDRIFERFAQADSSVSRKYRGTGLGLALAKEYVEMHGGDITLESELGHGSAFTVHLPIRQATKGE